MFSRYVRSKITFQDRWVRSEGGWCSLNDIRATSGVLGGAGALSTTYSVGPGVGARIFWNGGQQGGGYSGPERNTDVHP